MEITANAIQLVNANNDVMFTDTPVPGNPSIINREGSGLVKLRGLTYCQSRARFRVFFNGNIAIPAGGTAPQQISLVIALDGEPVNATWMAVTPPGDDQYFNVAAAIYIDVPAGCCSNISVRNNSAIAINVANANLIVERVA